MRDEDGRGEGSGRVDEEEVGSVCFIVRVLAILGFGLLHVHPYFVSLLCLFLVSDTLSRLLHLILIWNFYTKRYISQSLGVMAQLNKDKPVCYLLDYVKTNNDIMKTNPT